MPTSKPKKGTVPKPKSSGPAPYDDGHDSEEEQPVAIPKKSGSRKPNPPKATLANKESPKSDDEPDPVPGHNPGLVPIAVDRPPKNCADHPMMVWRHDFQSRSNVPDSVCLIGFDLNKTKLDAEPIADMPSNYRAFLGYLNFSNGQDFANFLKRDKIQKYNQELLRLRFGIRKTPPRDTVPKCGGKSDDSALTPEERQVPGNSDFGFGAEKSIFPINSINIFRASTDPAFRTLSKQFDAKLGNDSMFEKATLVKYGGATFQGMDSKTKLIKEMCLARAAMVLTRLAGDRFDVPHHRPNSPQSIQLPVHPEALYKAIVYIQRHNQMKNNMLPKEDTGAPTSKKAQTAQTPIQCIYSTGKYHRSKITGANAPSSSATGATAAPVIKPSRYYEQPYMTPEELTAFQNKFAKACKDGKLLKDEFPSEDESDDDEDDDDDDDDESEDEETDNEESDDEGGKRKTTGNMDGNPSIRASRTITDPELRLRIVENIGNLGIDRSVLPEHLLNGTDYRKQRTKPVRRAILREFGEDESQDFEATIDKLKELNELSVQATTSRYTDETALDEPRADNDPDGNDPQVDPLAAAGAEKRKLRLESIKNDFDKPELGFVSYQEACERLGVNPDKPGITNKSTDELILAKEHQIGGAGNMMKAYDRRGSSRVYACSDEAGSGKTMQGFILVRQITIEVAKGPGPWKPILILCAPILVLNWLREGEPFRGDLLFYALGDKSLVEGKSYVTHLTNRELSRAYEPGGVFDPNQPKTARAVIIASYNTFARRTLYNHDKWQKKKGEVSKQLTRMKSNYDKTTHPTSKDKMDLDQIAELNDLFENPVRRNLALLSAGFKRNAFGVDGLKKEVKIRNKDPDDESMTNQDMIKTSHKLLAERSNVLRRRLNVVVLDEGHYIRNPMTRIFQSVITAESNWYVLLTATPVMNRLSDMGTYMMLGRPLDASEGTNSWPADWLISSENIVERYKALAEHAPDGFDPLILDPVPFLTVLDSKDGMSFFHACIILPIIFKCFRYRRRMGQKYPTSQSTHVIIGGDIPDQFVKEIRLPRLRDTPFLRQKYDQQLRQLSSRLRPKRPQDKSLPPRVDMEATRIMQAATLMPTLASLHHAHKGKTRIEHVRQWMEEEDYGLDRLILYTLGQVEMDPALLHNPEYLLNAICLRSPKTQANAYVTGTHVFRDGFKVVIFQETNMGLWMTALTLMLMGIQVAVLQSKQTAETRARIIDDFNTENGEAQVLLSTYRVAAHGINLHKNCHVLINLEPASSCAVEEQARNRIYRLGQTQPQMVYNITMDHSFDMVKIRRNATKHFSSLAGEYSDLLERIAMIKLDMHVIRNKEKPDDVDKFMDDARLSAAEAIFCAQTGLISSPFNIPFQKPQDLISTDDKEADDLGAGAPLVPQDRYASILAVKAPEKIQQHVQRLIKEGATVVGASSKDSTTCILCDLFKVPSHRCGADQACCRNCFNKHRPQLNRDYDAFCGHFCKKCKNSQAFEKQLRKAGNAVLTGVPDSALALKLRDLSDGLDPQHVRQIAKDASEELYAELMTVVADAISQTARDCGKGRCKIVHVPRMIPVVSRFRDDPQFYPKWSTFKECLYCQFQRYIGKPVSCTTNAKTLGRLEHACDNVPLDQVTIVPCSFHQSAINHLHDEPQEVTEYNKELEKYRQMVAQMASQEPGSADTPVMVDGTPYSGESLGRAMTEASARISLVRLEHDRTIRNEFDRLLSKLHNCCCCKTIFTKDHAQFVRQKNLAAAANNQSNLKNFLKPKPRTVDQSSKPTVARSTELSLLRKRLAPTESLSQSPSKRAKIGGGSDDIQTESPATSALTDEVDISMTDDSFGPTSHPELESTPDLPQGGSYKQGEDNVSDMDILTAPSEDGEVTLNALAQPGQDDDKQSITQDDRNDLSPRLPSSDEEDSGDGDSGDEDSGDEDSGDEDSGDEDFDKESSDKESANDDLEDQAADDVGGSSDDEGMNSDKEMGSGESGGDKNSGDENGGDGDVAMEGDQA